MLIECLLHTQTEPGTGDTRVYISDKVFALMKFALNIPCWTQIWPQNPSQHSAVGNVTNPLDW